MSQPPKFAVYQKTAARDEARRLTDYNPEAYRTEFRRDAARLVHNAAFRRLQGKTQLFPSFESDFFRNRLTHSIEVGQVAKSIAIRLNATEQALRDADGIDPDLCEFAGNCHDLGHPPFGHNGEEALHNCMEKHGGWEGNAQTLRILAKLAKRQLPLPPVDRTGISDSGADQRLGLNLTARSLAAILKYDQVIPRSGGTFSKGYYEEEADLVAWIKSSVLGRPTGDEVFKTIECQIMDIADDIAYSTYDLEDAFHAGFLSPASVLAAPPSVLERVARGVSDAIGSIFTPADVLRILRDTFVPSRTTSGLTTDFDKFRDFYATSEQLRANGNIRVSLTSDLVGEFIGAVTFTPNWSDPALSEISLQDDARRKVEVLKRLTYVLLIESPRFRIARYRGQEIVTSLFRVLSEQPELLPHDWIEIHERLEKPARPRLVADFIASMTDRYALEFYGRLKSESPQTIFKPL